jgi:hypothetical protein
MMTMKDYQKAAEIVSDVAFQDKQAKTAYASAVRQAFVRFFKNDNPRFNVNRFHEACEATNSLDRGAKLGDERGP